MKIHIVTLLATITALAGCARMTTHSTSLAISNAVREGAATLDVGAICDTSWDRLFVFGPYSGESDVHDELGYEWTDFNKSGIEMNDASTLLVFVKDGKVVDWFNHPRGQGDFAFVGRAGGYARAEAVFTIERTGTEQRATIRFKEDGEQKPAPYFK